MKIPTYFHPSYHALTPTASMRKLPVVASEIERLNLATLLNPYHETTPHECIEALYRLHNPEYVLSFLEGIGELSESNGFPWSPEICRGVIAINAGMIAGAKRALETGIAANIAQGFHHAEYEQGGGFCTFNGLTLVAQENPDKRIMILDVDEHQGNGTMDFLPRLPNLYNFTIYGTHFDGKITDRYSALRNREHIFHAPVTHHWESYMEAIYDACMTALEDWKPDLIIYQAGVDCHIDDPLGSLGITTEQLKARDQKVFQFCHDFKIPCLFVLAGGYQTPLELTANLHANTFRMASEVYENS